MVMKADVLARAVDAAGIDDRPRLLMSPRGRPLTQQRVADLAGGPGAIIICGRFEGVDQRVIDAYLGAHHDTELTDESVAVIHDEAEQELAQEDQSDE